MESAASEISQTKEFLTLDRLSISPKELICLVRYLDALFRVLFFLA